MTKIGIQDLEDAERLDTLISAGASANDLVGGKTLLALAASRGYVDSCRLLLQAGADPNVAGEGSGSGSVLANLLDSRFSMLNQMCDIPDPVISDADMEAIAVLLVEYGADPNFGVDGKGVIAETICPLFIAAAHRDIKGLQLLVRLGANPDQKCNERKFGYENTRTILQDAINHRREDVAIALLRLGAVDSDQLSGGRKLAPFQFCVERGCDKMVEYYVRERGENPSQMVMIGSQWHPVSELAVRAGTKTLLRSLETEMAIKNALDIEIGESMPVVDSKRKVGMAL